MIPFSLYIKEYYWKLWSKVLQIFLLFSLYFSSLNLKFTKMELSRFAMKLYTYTLFFYKYMYIRDINIMFTCAV